MNFNKLIPTFLCFVFTCLFFSPMASAQTTEWAKSYGGNQDEHGYDIEKTDDDGFIVIGSAESKIGDVSGNNGPNGTRDIWVVKLDKEGDLEWQKNYGGSGNDDGRSIAPTQDGGYIFTGAVETGDGDIDTHYGSKDFWLVKIDASGSIQWQKTLGANDWDFPEALLETPDGGFVVAGINYTFFNKLDYMVYKLDANGEVEWQEKYGGTEDEYLRSIELTDDQGFIITGRSRSDDKDVSDNYGDYDWWMVKLDQHGELEWEGNYGGTAKDEAAYVKQLPDGGYIAVGESKSTDFDLTNNYGGADLWAVRLDAFGQIVWQKSFGGSEYDSATSVEVSSDGGFAILGTSSSADQDVSSNNGLSDFWMIKIDGEGNLLYEQNYGGDRGESGHSMVSVGEGEYVLTGVLRSWEFEDHNGGQDMWVIKVKEQKTALQENFSISSIEVFPNPSSGYFSIKQTYTNEVFSISLFDQLGRARISEISTADPIEVSGLEAGVYWLEISTEERMEYRKIIVVE